ncbi:carboxypeptidase-like regulatory domain-containing protein [Aurantibacillus circumpalustris]|uniref:carboxypeptidase-like regulatory domain-containing protein n=1 Tax=Aurantibacillus circumpalustris TaxID=3036359 RepID=UPI00295A5EA2|nr:carboxypeptidase-like regulatory domain-containing protein [Aurantibacillus circumpalustris]
MKKLLYILLFVSFSGVSLAGNSDKEKSTTKVIAGKITDSYGESIPGAKILIPETGETFFADMDGNFKLSIKTDKEYSLKINTIGFEPLEVKATYLSAFSDLSLKSL